MAIMKNIHEILSVLEHNIAAVEQSLSGSTGERSLCQLHKDGKITGGMKYDEGRYAALRKIRRIVKSNKAVEITPETSKRLRQEAEEWQRMLQAYQYKPERPMPWIAYAQGGLDAITELQRLLKRKNMRMFRHDHDEELYGLSERLER